MIGRFGDIVCIEPTERYMVLCPESDPYEQCSLLIRLDPSEEQGNVVWAPNDMLTIVEEAA